MTLPGQKPKLRFRKSSDVIWESNRSAGWIGTQRETISAQRVAIQIESVPIRNSYHHSGSGSSPGLTPDAQRPMVLRKKVEVASSRLLTKISALEVCHATKPNDVIPGGLAGNPKGRPEDSGTRRLSLSVLRIGRPRQF